MVAEGAMPLLAETFFQRYDNQLTAVLSLVVAFSLILLVDRTIKRRGRQVRSAIGLDQLDPVVDTRLRFVRRLVEATIAIIGVAVALSQFAALDRLATSILASGALAAAVIGFAARQTLANGVAGVLLFVSQPLRIGDLVTFEGQTGTVEDVRLAYTWLRAHDDTRVIIPNERLAAGVIRNDSIITPRVVAEISIWLPAHADADLAVELLTEQAGDEGTVSLAEMDPEGRVRLTVTGTAGAAHDRAACEADLRADCLRTLRAAGLLSTAPA
jgi:small-conductance mechanosensitive channel